MNASFFQRLEERAKAINSLLCVGLDPHAADLNEPTGAAAFAFCKRIIDATRDLAAAFKPNAAFFEQLGPDGVQALVDVIAYIGPEVPVLLDVKRGDISSTAAAYSKAAFEVAQANAVTLNPLMGWDSVAPFAEDKSRGAFLLCKTSNPSAADLLSLETAQGIPLYLQIADLTDRWTREKGAQLGLVIGATQVEAIQQVRAAHPGLWLLTPGVGAQGGNLAEATRAGLREDGLGMLIPVSRGISRAEDPRAAAENLVAAIRDAQAAASAPRQAIDLLKDQIAEDLVETGCVRFGTFTLKSGLESPIYIDLRRLVAFPAVMRRASRAYLHLLADLEFESIAALPYAALPIGSAVSLMGDIPMIYPRKESKSYGTRASIEGIFSEGDKTVILDDLATTGGSKIEALEKLSGAGLIAKDIVVLIDRESGAREAMEEAGCTMHSIFTLRELLGRWSRVGAISAEQEKKVRAFLGEK